MGCGARHRFTAWLLCSMLGGCGPSTGGDGGDAGDTGGTDSEATSTTPTTSTTSTTSTTTSPGTTTYDVGVQPDVGGLPDDPAPPPCEPDATSLEVIWQVTDPDRMRAESVWFTPEGLILWTAADSDGTTLHAYDPEAGADVWTAQTEFWMGMDDLTTQDVVALEDAVVLGGMTAEAGGGVVGLRWYALDGQLVDSLDALPDPTLFLGELAPHDGGVVVVSNFEKAIRVERFQGGSDWAVMFGDDQPMPAEVGTSVAVDSTGAIIVAGSIDDGPQQSLVFELSPDGELQWSVVDEGVGEDRALAVTVDAQDRPVVVGVLHDGGFIRRYDSEGTLQLDVSTAAALHGVHVDLGGRIVVVGNHVFDGAIAQRFDAEANLLDEATFGPGWVLDLVADEACNVYAVGDSGGAWLAKLR